MGRKPIDDSIVKSLFSLHEQQLTPYAIARELGISYSTVYKYLNDEGLTPNLKQSKGLEIEKDLLKEYYEGKPMLEITKKYKVSSTWVYNLLRRRKLEPRTIKNEYKEDRLKMINHALSLYQQTNLTVGAIVLETGISQPTIHKELRKRNMPFRSPKKAGGRNASKK